jgi:peptidoglycan/xylan/chitin deacetylase (PgdA/CDA1 family)
MEETSGKDSAESSTSGPAGPFVIYGVLEMNGADDAKNSSVAVVNWFKEDHDKLGKTPATLKGSYAMFDDEWNPIEFHGKKSNLDSAIILYAAQQLKEGAGKALLQDSTGSSLLINSDGVDAKGGSCEVEEESSNAKEDSNRSALVGPITLFQSFQNRRESQLGSSLSNNSAMNVAGPFHSSKIPLDAVKSMVEDGQLPMVPVKRSSAHQFLIQQSVDWFFRQETVRFFACQPYRFSPRTIYRFPSTINPSKAEGVVEKGPTGYIALTIDDAPCRLDNRDSSKLSQVLDLLQRYKAKATFMVIQQFLTSAHEPDLVRLLREGHEMANHGVQDAAMSSRNDYPTPDTFVRALKQCNERIEALQDLASRGLGDETSNLQHGVKWFRAPHGKYTKLMEQGLEKLDMYNVMCDVYAVDPVVEDGEWIARSLCRQAKDGSIILIHMPEKGFREYCLTALELLLEELCAKQGFQIVTVSELERISNTA